MSPLRAALAVLLLAACSADVQVDRACVTTQGFTIPAGVPGTPPAEVPVGPFQLSYAVGAVIPDLNRDGVHDVHFWARSFELTSTQSTAFVRRLAVRVLPPSGSTLTARDLGEFQAVGPGAATGVHVPADGTDLVPYMQSGRITLEISGTADPSKLSPTSATAEGALCAEVQGSVDYLKAL